MTAATPGQHAPADVRIVTLEAVQFSAPLVTPVRYGTIERKRSASALIRIKADNGVVGYGEACCVPQLTGESAESVVSLVDLYLRGVVVGSNALNWRRTMAEIRRRFPKSFVALSAVETAMVDLVGKHLGVSASHLLGSRYRNRIELCACVSWDKDPTAMAADAAEKSADYQVLKLYAGPEELGSDLRRLTKVREAVGVKPRIMLDVKGLWSAHTAIAAAPALHELGVFLVEQPVAPRDRAGAIKVTQIYADRFGMLTNADEAAETPDDVLQLSEAGAYSSFNIGVTKMGGPDIALRAAHVAQAAHTAVIVGSFAELGIATAAGLHLAASLGDLVAPSYLSGPDRYTETITTPSLLAKGGHVDVPDGPGLGIQVDEDRITSMIDRAGQ